MGVTPSNRHCDLPIWRWTSSGLFSIHSLYNFLIDGGRKASPQSQNLEGALSTQSKDLLMVGCKRCNFNLGQHSKDSVAGSELFVLCKGYGEVTSHLLITCPFSAHVQTKCASLVGLHIYTTEIVDIWHSLSCAISDKTLVGLVVAAIYWNIWREKNNIIFNHTRLLIDDCVCRSHLDFSLWARQLSD